MMLSLSVSLIWLLAVLAAAAQVQDVPRRALMAAGIVLAFAATLGAAMTLSPQPNWIGVLAGIGAFWRLIAGPMPRGGMGLAGGSAALAAALQIGGGISPLVAVPLAGGALMLAFLLRRPASANGRRELERVLIIAALALPIIGLAGDLMFGWHAATMLNRNVAAITTATAAPVPPAWTIAIVGFAIVAGLIRGMWIKR